MINDKTVPCNKCKEPMKVAKFYKGIEVVGGTCWKCVTKMSLGQESKVPTGRKE